MFRKKYEWVDSELFRMLKGGCEMRGLIIMLCIAIGYSGSIHGISEMDLASVTAFGKGYATVAQFNGIESTYVNPAGVSDIHSFEISSSISSFYDNMYHVSNVSMATNIFDSISVVLNIPFKSVPDIPLVNTVNGTGVITGSIQDTYLKPALHMGTYLFENLAVGLGLHYHSRELDTLDMTGIGLDIGVILKQTDWALGISYKNVGNTSLSWSDGYDEMLSEEMLVGIDLKLSPLLQLSASLEDPAHRSMVHVGVDYQLSEEFVWFSGIHDLNNQARFSSGGSLSLGNLTFQYSYSLHPTLGTVHKVGLHANY